jgi:hypothetical protein
MLKNYQGNDVMIKCSADCKMTLYFYLELALVLAVMYFAGFKVRESTLPIGNIFV